MIFFLIPTTIIAVMYLRLRLRYTERKAVIEDLRDMNLRLANRIYLAHEVLGNLAEKRK